MRKAREERGGYDTGTEAPIEVRHKNPLKELGFAAMEHALTLDTDLSDGAYRTYALLKFYWQHKDNAFPTVDTMAEKRGIRRETIGVHLKELVDKKLITRKPRVGTSTMTYLEDLPQEYVDIALAELERRDARREENLTATLEKSNARREENLTQSTTIKEKEREVESTALPESAKPFWQRFQTTLEKAGDLYAHRFYRQFLATWQGRPEPAAWEYALSGLGTHFNGFRVFLDVRTFFQHRQHHQ